MAKVNWDDDGPTLSANLRAILREAEKEARERKPLTTERMRQWHARLMQGLVLPDPGYAGCYRGSGAAEHCDVLIGGKQGTPASEVGDALRLFEDRLARAISLLDTRIEHALDSADNLNTVLDLCAWAHSEWVRIHPFANGNGRTARLWANIIAVRYGLPPFVRLRPRPGSEYGRAAALAMAGHWRPTVPVFHDMLDKELRR